MEITEGQYETLVTIFPDCSIDVLSFEQGVRIVVTFEEEDKK